jgi:small subunit ribosomal protein S11
MAEEIAKEKDKEKAAAEEPVKAKAAKGEKAEKAKKPAKGKKKPKKRLLTEGRVYIQASFNNTLITVTDTKGEVIAWASAGSSGFKGPRKATPYAAQIASESAITKAKAFGLERVRVYVKGAGTGREQAIRGLQAGGVNIDSLTDLTPIPHNGCRPRKGRRV